VGCHFLLQRIFPTQGSNVGLLHCSNTYPIHWIRPSHRGRLKAEEKRVTEDEVVEWHHRLNGNGHGQTLRDGEGWGGLTCCSSWVAESGTDLVLEQQQHLTVMYSGNCSGPPPSSLWPVFSIKTLISPIS